MKKILFIYPHNFLECNMGTNIRVYSLAKELHSQGYMIDLFAFRNFLSVYDDFDNMNYHEKIIDTLFCMIIEILSNLRKEKEYRNT